MEGQGAGTPGFEDVVYSHNARPPVVLFKITHAKENTKSLNVDTPPVQHNWRIKVSAPATKPKALGLGPVKLGVRRVLETGINIKGGPDTII